MTFRESEFPNMVTQIETVLSKYPPEALRWYLAELVRIYRAIPVYPGLVGVCLAKAFEACTAEKPPAKGSPLVVWPMRGECVAGKLAAWTKAGVQVEAHHAGKTVRLKWPHRSLKRVERFRADTLEAFWPTLVFEKKPAKRRAS